MTFLISFATTLSLSCKIIKHHTKDVCLHWEYRVVCGGISSGSEEGNGNGNFMYSSYVMQQQQDRF